MVPYNTMYDMVINKDMLIPGNEEYGPIRYYDNTDEIRVVARSRYKFPDEDSYYKRLKEEEDKKDIAKSSKSKNYKHKKGRPYMNTAEGFINQNEKEIYRRYYNLEMAQYETAKELEKVQY